MDIMKYKHLNRKKTTKINMELRKAIKRMGNSAVILITAEELKLYNLKLGDEIKFTITNQKEFDNDVERQDFKTGYSRCKMGGGSETAATIEGERNIIFWKKVREEKVEKDKKKMRLWKKEKARSKK